MLLLEKNRKNEKKPEKPGGNEKSPKKNRYFTKIEPYLYEFVANESRFGIYTRKTKEILFDKIPYVSKYLTFNILREYSVACCVFFYRSFDFRTYFLEKPVHSVFSVFFGRFSVFVFL